uniref:U21-Deinotoxin-Dsu1a_1 n=1 Tax=Deinopis subrufa TaxID=1905329 RepID=A0A4Q8KCP8_DEISU
MKLVIIAVVATFLLLDAVKCVDPLQESGLLPEPRNCAKPDESCSKGRYGHGPPCCPPKGCSCNPFTRNCHCYWDSLSAR